jgi:hypothetical protein
MTQSKFVRGEREAGERWQHAVGLYRKVWRHNIGTICRPQTLSSIGLLRVYSAVRRLRRLGLEPILVTRDDGYLLEPDADARRAES